MFSVGWCRKGRVKNPGLRAQDRFRKIGHNPRRKNPFPLVREKVRSDEVETLDLVGDEGSPTLFRNLDSSGKRQVAKA